MKIRFISFIILLFLITQTKVTHAQFDILGKVKDKIEQKAEEKTDEAIDKAVDEAEKDATEKKSTDQKQQEDENGNGGNTAAKSSNTDEKPNSTEEGLKNFSKFDFIPGEKVIFFEDFSQDNVADFPAKWNTNGTGEVVTLNNYPGKWLKCRNGSLYVPDIPKPFPDNMTIEFDMLLDGKTESGNIGNVNFMLIASDGSKEYMQHAYTMHEIGQADIAFEISISKDNSSTFYAQNYSKGDFIPVNSNLNDAILLGKFGKIVRVSMAIQKTRFRIWIDGKKIYDLPKLVPPATYDIFKMGLWYFDDQDPEAYQVLFSNFRFAVGQPDMRSKLITEGKLVTHGINFDVNSDKIKPESYGTLKEIAKILKENPAVKVKIIGHTDSDGSDAANLELSKKRSLSVKKALADEFGIETSRMETDGKGESEPISDNATIEGKANNRRVEFIKL